MTLDGGTPAFEGTAEWRRFLHRRRLTMVLLACLLAGVAGVVAIRPTESPSFPPSSPPPTSPTTQIAARPAPVCDNAEMLSGPDVQPPESVRIDPGRDLDSATQAAPAGTVFWLSPGTHTLVPDEYGQVIPKDNNTYIGAPGAVLDGRNVNRFAFTQRAVGVTIRYLTIQNFGVARGNNNEGVVNHDSGDGWVIERNTIQRNAGAGVFLGSDNTLRFNCLRENRQYGFSMFRPPLPGGANAITDIVIDGNEIVGNNTDDWEAVQPGCGCTGGGKFWDVGTATVSGNWVHRNRGVGLWIDTNGVGFVIEGNYLNDNDSEGIFYELSYNARIVGNTLKRNALVKGRSFADAGDNFPVGAIYISESGGDARVGGGSQSTLTVAANYLEDNWSGVVLWENADRFLNSPANTSGTDYVPKGGIASITVCNDPAAGGTIDLEPAFSDCRWKTQNVSVTDNDFLMDKAAVGCADSAASCGLQAIISNWGTFPDWSPYRERTVQEAITFHQNNRFSSNRYRGDWRFNVYEPGRIVDFATWQAEPYRQDVDSTKQ